LVNVADGTGTREITDTTLVGELSQKDDNDGRKAQFPVVSAPVGSTIEVTNQFGAVIKVGDKRVCGHGCGTGDMCQFVADFDH